MKVRRAKRIGFCFGVRRAVEMAEAALEKGGPICSLGSIIHNEQVVGALSKKGLKVVSDVDSVRSGVCVISSHGISPVIAGKIARRGVRLVDTTCPFVLNAQKVTRSLTDPSYSVIIVGDEKHPEIRALVDFVPNKKSLFVVNDEAGARSLGLKQNGKFIIISQTTQSINNFLSVVKAVMEKRPKELRIFNTICSDAEERQQASRELARSVDVMLVVGGKNSANTKRLLEVCKATLKDSYLVETEKDLRKRWFKKKRVAGITSGASTPDWIVQKVVHAVNKIH